MLPLIRHFPVADNLKRTNPLQGVTLGFYVVLDEAFAIMLRE